MKPLPELSSLEMAVLQLLAEGNRTSEIAKRLGLEYRTTAAAVTSIKSKLNVQSGKEFTELLKYYQSVTNPEG